MSESLKVIPTGWKRVYAILSIVALAYIESLKAQLAAQPSVQRDEDGIGWCSSCDKIHEVARPKCPSCGDWLIFAADDKPEDSAKSFNDGVKAATDYLRKTHYMHTLADLADKTVLRITAERGSK